MNKVTMKCSSVVKGSGGNEQVKLATQPSGAGAIAPVITTVTIDNAQAFGTFVQGKEYPVDFGGPTVSSK